MGRAKSQSQVAINARETYQGRKNVACPICGELFAGNFNTNQHIREKHTKEKPFKCHICHTAFSRQFGLNRHLKSVHNEDVPKGRRCRGTKALASESISDEDMSDVYLGEESGGSSQGEGEGVQEYYEEEDENENDPTVQEGIQVQPALENKTDLTDTVEQDGVGKLYDSNISDNRNHGPYDGDSASTDAVPGATNGKTISRVDMHIGEDFTTATQPVLTSDNPSYQCQQCTDLYNDAHFDDGSYNDEKADSWFEHQHSFHGVAFDKACYCKNCISMFGDSHQIVIDEQAAIAHQYNPESEIVHHAIDNPMDHVLRGLPGEQPEVTGTAETVLNDHDDGNYPLGSQQGTDQITDWSAHLNNFDEPIFSIPDDLLEPNNGNNPLGSQQGTEQNADLWAQFNNFNVPANFSEPNNGNNLVGGQQATEQNPDMWAYLHEFDESIFNIPENPSESTNVPELDLNPSFLAGVQTPTWSEIEGFDFENIGNDVFMASNENEAEPDFQG